jgi:hypothetical protein
MEPTTLTSRRTSDSHCDERRSDASETGGKTQTLAAFGVHVPQRS